MDKIVQRAVNLIQQEKIFEAEELLKNCLKRDPKNLNIILVLANLFSNQNKFIESESLFLRANEILPNSASITYNLGRILMLQQKFSQARPYFEQSIKLDPNSFWGLTNYGIVLFRLGLIQDASNIFKVACDVDVNNAFGWSNFGNALQAAGKYSESIEAYKKALQLRSNDYPEVWSNMAVALQGLLDFDQALASCDKALLLNPFFAEAWFNKGNIFLQVNKLSDAIVCFLKAVDIKKDYLDAYLNLSVTYHILGQYNLADLAIDRVIQLNSSDARAWNHKGVIAHDLNQYVVAVDCFIKAHALNAEYDYLIGNLLNLQGRLCDWSNFEPQLAQFLTRAALGQKVAPPFHAIALLDSGILQKQIAQTWIADKHPSSLSSFLPPLQSPVRGPKIRLAYFSADFHNHATMFLMAKLFECHDRSQFELFAFSFGPDSSDVMRQRAVAAFDHFLDVRGQSDLEIAALSRKLQIDIAVDLKGFTQHARTSIFAYRAAPIQVNYLGYPGTMGAPYIDYIVADRVLVPPGNEHFYSEKVIYMPHSYQVNDDERPIANTVYTREQLGLPDTAFVFCCFNNNYKILPTTLDSWLRILGAVSGSVLWLLADNPTAVKNLQQAVRDRGGDPSRLIFAQRMPLAEHLARHRQADLFLDTLPCNAHTTASDALWAGLPLLTWAGEAFAGRVSASLLSAMNLPELITHSQAEYEQRAIEIAHDPNQLTQLKAKVAQMRHISPLFKTQQYAHDLEAAYQEMIKSV
ncbi:hypothetical protein PHIN8_15370 [Polynucleobacter sp. HIN8]|uniref:tetratricopeptide repeat protein n=1 Tax=Polynucleobacter sp. HIN8 TaxID=3047867 RepID=UPI0025726268|nr:glycosyltransferase family 41 protein [Polynucleobacter sp. HIN8]BEI39593.1 hypothetical protein PHIN8_15370 [Polynucleobacter sp. HIN8]